MNLVQRPAMVRKLSSIVGKTGRVYVRDRALRVHPTRPDLNIYLAHHENKPYVMKPVSTSIFEQSVELRHEFGTDPHLRTHIDDDQRESTLIFEYLKDDLLSFVANNPNLPIKARKHILRQVGEGLRSLHSKNWIHLDLKPNNVLLDWSLDEENQVKIDRVALSDLDCALRLKGNKLLNHRIGNVMWRSPEGQAGRGIGKSSEMFSFGLMCLFTVTGVEALHPDFKQLKEDGIEPEQVILYKLLSMFGPAPPELLKLIDDEYWNELLNALSDVVSEEDTNARFESWNENEISNLDTSTKNLILRMTNLNPNKRATIDEILEDPWWNCVESVGTFQKSHMSGYLCKVLERRSLSKLTQRLRRCYR